MEVFAVGIDEEVVRLLEEGAEAEAVRQQRLFPFLRFCRWVEHNQQSGRGGWN